MFNKMEKFKIINIKIKIKIKLIIEYVNERKIKK